MKRDRGMEVATYIIVFLLIWVISPLLGKFIDSFVFDYPKIFADSLLMILAGFLLILPGAILAGWTIYLFKVKGQGTPNPMLPPKKLIITGPYRFSRNPMALGGLLTLLGEALVYYSPSLSVIAVTYGLIVYLNAIFVEEPELRKRFGPPYEEYLEKAPRFFPNPFKFYK
jgi:protein-S-isoprenylcysteine O-methyltransferase Ste14